MKVERTAVEAPNAVTLRRQPLYIDDRWLTIKILQLVAIFVFYLQWQWHMVVLLISDECASCTILWVWVRTSATWLICNVMYVSDRHHGYCSEGGPFTWHHRHRCPITRAAAGQADSSGLIQVDTFNSPNMRAIWGMEQGSAGEHGEGGWNLKQSNRKGLRTYEGFMLKNKGNSTSKS